MKQGDLFPIASYYDLAQSRMVHPKEILTSFRIEYIGAFREPRAGEWFISGAIPEGYFTNTDLSIRHPIGRLVRIKEETIISVIERF